MQNITPRYQKRYFPEAKRKNQLVTIISNEEGVNHCWINQNAKLSLGYFDANQQVDYSFSPQNKAIYLFVIDGSVSINGEIIAKRDAIGIWETDKISLHTEQESRFIVVEVPVNH